MFWRDLHHGLLASRSGPVVFLCSSKLFSLFRQYWLDYMAVTLAIVSSKTARDAYGVSLLLVVDRQIRPRQKDLTWFGNPGIRTRLTNYRPPPREYGARRFGTGFMF
jgi:hypothetical protein